MGKYDTQRAAHEFLIDHLRSRKPFTLRNFDAVTGSTKPGSYRPYLQKHFVGYSISHVDGRFRSAGILAHDEVAKLQERGERYLVDETTAVTRFIFPYQSVDELERVRFLFQELFVRSIIQLVDVEEQIW